MSLLMSSTSNVWCRPENSTNGTTAVRCGCGTLGFKYELNEDTCISSCSDGLQWSRVDGSPDVWAGVEAGTCGSCAWGKEVSPTDDSRCSRCEALYLLSSDCSVPVFGIVLFGTILVLLALAAQVVWHRCKRHRQELDESHQETELTLANMALMAAAWEIAWNAIELHTRLAAGNFGEVWSATLNGKYTVAVKKMFKSVSLFPLRLGLHFDFLFLYKMYIIFLLTDVFSYMYTCRKMWTWQRIAR